MNYFYTYDSDDNSRVSVTQPRGAANGLIGDSASSYMTFLASTAPKIAANVPERADVIGAAILGYNQIPERDASKIARVATAEKRYEL